MSILQYTALKNLKSLILWSRKVWSWGEVSFLWICAEVFLNCGQTIKGAAVEKGLLFVLKGLVGNQFSECKYKLVGTTRTLLSLFWMRLNRFQGRSGGTERRSLSVWSPRSPRSHRGLFKPQHLSRFTTQLVEKPLAWRTRRGAEQRLETASRHLRALSRVIVRVRLPVYLPTIFHNWSQVCLRDRYENIYTEKAHKEAKHDAVRRTIFTEA